MSLVADKISVNYGKSKVVTEVSLTIEQGEKVALLGRNGVGKTTLMKGLIGVLPIDGKGTLSLDDTDLTKKPAHMHNLAGIGYVPQGREIIPDLTVKENLELGGLGHKDVDSKKQYDMVLNYFPALTPHLGRPGGVLSGGQQQQLAIARCLMGAPKILLLDEPTEGIQPNVVFEIASIINKISREMGLSVVVVEQNLKFARRIAERFLIMQKGQIVCSGQMNELTDEVSKKYLSV
ncbi:MAG: ATP-binding cassette domain-containing protein [Clostridiales bacterium]|nr:ATP-binding cassette domain-containing protein [Clostridiales bacterium]